MVDKVLFFLFFSMASWSQDTTMDFDRIGAIVDLYPQKFKTSKSLADQIEKDFNTEMDKAKAIFSWITKNISYDYKESGQYYTDYANSYKSVQYNPFPSFRSSNYIEYDKSKSGSKKHLETEKKYRTKLSKRVISNRKAVCEGYAQLFKDLCDHLDITCFYILGKAKNQINHIGDTYKIDHAWNIIEIDFKKYLVDATWGSTGYYDVNTKEFVQKPNYQYFDTNPSVFIQEHYPDFYENSLLKKQISKKEFSDAPLFYRHSKSKGFNLVSPTYGILKRSKNDAYEFVIAYNEPVHSIVYLVNNKQFRYKGKILYDDDNVSFTIDMPIPNAQELILFINEIPMIGFKVE